jgi:catechol 2,3-dioxygenase-like lactoylglutathione lyase family enzyme
MTEVPPQLGQLNIVVSDMERSLAFYRQLGVDVPNIWQGSNGQQHASAASAGFDLDFDSPAFASAWNRGWAGRSDLAGRVVVGFKVADRATVDRLYAALTSEGHKSLQQPYDAFWGARYAVVEDPDGLAIGLMSPIDAALRTTPPA